MGRSKSCFVVVIFSKIDWNPGQDFAKIPKNAGLPKTKNLFGNLEFTLISDYKAKSYVNSGSYDEVYGKKYRPPHWIGQEWPNTICYDWLNIRVCL